MGTFVFADIILEYIHMISQSILNQFKKKYDVVSLFLIFDEKILLLRRQKNKPYEGTWGPPAGKKDPSENLEEAICRETFEETGIKLLPKNISKSKIKYFVRHENIDFLFYVFSTKLNEKPKIILEPLEHCEYSWFTPKEALQIDLVKDEHIPISDFF